MSTLANHLRANSDIPIEAMVGLRAAGRGLYARDAPVPAFPVKAEKGSAGCRSYLISGGKLGFNHLNSRLRGNDGVGNRNRRRGNRPLQSNVNAN